MTIQTQFILDEKGNKIAVVLPIDEYEKLLTINSKVKAHEIPNWQKMELDRRRAEYLENPDVLLDADRLFEELDKEFS